MKKIIFKILVASFGLCQINAHGTAIVVYDRDYSTGGYKTVDWQGGSGGLYTYASVFISAVDQVSAQNDYPGSFFTALSPTGNGLITDYITAGLWTTSNIDFVIRESTWDSRVYLTYDDAWGAMSNEGLVLYNGGASPVPGPLPILGAVAALAWSRKIRNRIKNVKREVINSR